jgi:adenylosuccinate synthase
MTRHGAGPLLHETDALPWANIVDPTNQPNPWQGTLRAAPLDLDETARFIRADLAFAEGSAVRVIPGIGISCLDQVRGEAQLVIDGALIRHPAGQFPELAAEHLGLRSGLQSWGPTRRDVRIPADAETPPWL